MPRPLMPKLVRARVVVAPEPPLGRYWCLCSRERARFERCLLCLLASGEALLLTERGLLSKVRARAAHESALLKANGPTGKGIRRLRAVHALLALRGAVVTAIHPSAPIAFALGGHGAAANAQGP